MSDKRDEMTAQQVLQALQRVMTVAELLARRSRPVEKSATESATTTQVAQPDVE